MSRLALAKYKNIKDLGFIKNIKNYYKNQIQLFLTHLLAFFGLINNIFV